jgi:hypothetical protein
MMMCILKLYGGAADVVLGVLVTGTRSKHGGHGFGVLCKK